MYWLCGRIERGLGKRATPLDDVAKVKNEERLLVDVYRAKATCKILTPTLDLTGI